MITVLSFGGGQDSTAILLKILYDQVFRALYVRGELLVVFSDTGDEHEETYRHLRGIAALCKKNGIKFFHLTPDLGYHPTTWPSLREWMESHDGLLSKAFPKSCTDNLKIKPIYNFLNRYIAREYGIPDADTNKRALKIFAKEYSEKIRVLIGIAKGEEGRIGDGSKDPVWMKLSIEKIYPLIIEGLDRQGCQDYILQMGHEVPPPSNCMLCPFMNDIELLWLYRFHPADFWYWVERERAKIQKWIDKLPAEKNLGVNGTVLLQEKLVQVEAKYGHMTNEALQEYKMSHGHCVKSKY